MKAFYEEALLKIAFKHRYDFQLVSIDGATMFMQSVHCASRPQWYGLFYYSAHLAGILSRKFASSDTVTGQVLFAGISKFISGKQRDQ